MDYSQLSDFEINRRVAVALGHSIDQEKYGSASVGAFHSDGIVYKSHDYCNNPADAWPIIVANLIEVSPDYDFTDESEEELRATGLWTANHVEVDGKSYYQSHQNPLRAAMIVFLMMQDANHA